MAKKSSKRMDGKHPILDEGRDGKSGPEKGRKKRKGSKKHKGDAKCKKDKKDRKRSGKGSGVDAGESVSMPRGKRNKALGARGEEAAERFLRRHGYEILERNWVCFAGEADIIAVDERALVFAEVKTRRGISHGFPGEAVNQAKRERYERIALAYVQQHCVGEVTVRFDVISIVVIAPDRALVRHHLGAFSAA